jgi:tetratricopeptide (TPR) repeat protein
LEETLKAVESLSSDDERQLLIVDLLVELSWIERSSEGLDKAIDRCKQAEDTLKIVEDKRRAGNLYHAMGKFFYEKASWGEADIYLDRSFEMKKQERETKGLVKVLSDLRVLYWASGELEKIEAISRDGVEVCKQQGDLKSQAEILISVLGQAFEDQRRYNEALTVYEASLSIREADDLIGKSLSLRRIGRVLRKQKEFVKALKIYKESLSFAEELEDAFAQAYALEGIGNTHRDEGRIEDAVKKYDEAVKIVSESDNLAGKISFLMDIGRNSYRDAGKFEKALEVFENCLLLRRESNNIWGITDTLNALGFLNSTRYSDLATALQYYKESLEIRKKLGRLLGVEMEMSNLASVYKQQGKLEEALEIFEELLKTRGKRGASSKAIILNHIGSIYYARGEIQKAFEFYKESLQLCEKDKRLGMRAFTLNYLGKIYTTLDNYEEALAVLEESLQLQEYLHRKAEPLTNIADVYYHQGKITEAMAKCEESLALSRQYGGRIQAGRTLHLMGKIRMQENNYDEALKYVQEAVDIFKTTGSRHLSEAEATLREIEERIEY